MLAVLVVVERAARFRVPRPEMIEKGSPEL